MSLAAGKLRHRVVLQASVQVQDSAGDWVQGWHSMGTVWAAIAPVSGREFIQSQGTQSEVTARITIRNRSDVTAGWRIVHGSKFYNIKGVLPDLDSGLEYLTLPCTEGVNQG